MGLGGADMGIRGGGGTVRSTGVIMKGDKGRPPVLEEVVGGNHGRVQGLGTRSCRVGRELWGLWGAKGE